MNNVTIRTVPQFTIRLLDNSLAQSELPEVCYDADGIRLFAHKVGNRWNVSESKTGVCVTQQQPTKDCAITVALALVKAEKVQCHVSKWTEALGEELVWEGCDG